MSKTEEITPPVAARDAEAPPRIDERYRIEKEIGRGGMGRVFVAHDRKLGRDVAIKVLASGMHGEEALRRFEREARATCALNHANILDVHDIGMHEGSPYIVSELLHGSTLRERLRKGPLSVQEASGYALQLAQGLSAAHEKGIVHRDLKPENLFITEEGRLKILDFGIAKLVAPMTLGTGETLPSPQPRTEEGAILGAVGYMSPEQARGQPADQRSDVFSFGTIFYEMLAGCSPFEHDSSVETAYAILNDDPPPLRGDVSATVRRVVQRCLAKRPEDRFQSARELVDVLASAGREPASAKKHRWALGAGAGLILVALAVLAGRLRLRDEGPGKGAPSIAVLPFADMSAQKDQEYFSDGIAEEILNALAQVPGLRVAARTSAFAFKGKNEDTGAIADKLHVATILEGSVRKAGDRIRITTQLINATDGYHLWSETYDRKLTDVFAVQDEIARAVVAALKLKLLQAPDSKDRRTAEPEAHNQYLLGRQFYLHNNVDGFRRAVQAYEKAVQLDPGYAPAWAGFALAEFRLADLGGGGDAATLAERQRFADGLRQALEAAEKAVRLGGDHADGYLTRGYLRAFINFDWEGARADLERGLSLKPGDADALNIYAAALLTPVGRLREAAAALRKAAELDPLNAEVWSSLGFVLVMSGELDAGREALTRSLEISPEQATTPIRLAYAFLTEGKPAAALEASQRSTDVAFRLFGAALAEHDLGNPGKSQRALDEIIQRWPYVAAYQIAEVYAWRGEKDAAFAWLQRASEQNDGGLITFKVDPLLRKLRGDPRYAALLKRLHLPPD
jgi:TolB-like protein/Tfp pilus assembly protein PilF